MTELSNEPTNAVTEVFGDAADITITKHTTGCIVIEHAGGLKFWEHSDVAAQNVLRQLRGTPVYKEYYKDEHGYYKSRTYTPKT